MIEPSATVLVRRQVEALLQQGFGSPRPEATVKVGEPFPVLNPDGSQHSWFVALEVGPKLAGFAQLLPSLLPLRFSSFQRGQGGYDQCPDVADWTDPDRIRNRAISIARADESLSDPILTYDQDPSRLAWRVLATSPTGASRSLFVAGTAVYEGGGGRGLG